MSIALVTREAVAASLESAQSARNHARIDRAILSGSLSVEGLLHRRFYPEIDTRVFDWPQRSRTSARQKLYLNQHELWSVSALSSGGTTIPPADYFLRPIDGPPYRHIEIDLSSSSAFSAGSTWQGSISIAGTFGADATFTADTTLAAALATATGTTVDVTACSRLGVGSLIQVDTEWMTVTARSALDTTQNIGGNLTASTADTAVAVTDGTAFAVDEVITVGTERMRVVDIVGNTLSVQRGWDGTVLAAHTSPADIYAQRRLTVRRGVQGSTAATHLLAAAVSVHNPPALVQELAAAEAIVELLQGGAGFARTVGSGESEREAAGRGLRDIRDRAYAAYGRQARMQSV